MRVGPSGSVLASAASWGCRVSSWLGGRLLAGDVPVLSGRASATTGKVVPERVAFTVPPRTVESGRTVDWLPGDPGAALGRYGQVVDVTVQAGGVDTRIGRYLITGWEEQDDGSIRVDGSGLLHHAEEDRLLTATGPRDDGTLMSEFLRMLPGYMTASFAVGLVDRPVPRTMEWDENRLDNLYKIADSWPARLRTDPWGQVVVSPPLPELPVPVLTLLQGERPAPSRQYTINDLFPIDDLFPLDDRFPGVRVRLPDGPPLRGTVLSAPLSDSREGAYNVFVARSSADGVEEQADAKVLSGPMDPSGPYRPVPKFYASPLLVTREQCQAAADAMRDESVRRSRVRRVTFAPDVRVDLDDPVEIITGVGTSREVRDYGYVIGYDHPLTVTDGPSRADVAVF